MPNAIAYFTTIKYCAFLNLCLTGFLNHEQIISSFCAHLKHQHQNDLNGTEPSYILPLQPSNNI